MLVPVLIGLWIAGEFLGREMVIHIGIRVSALPVADAGFHPRVR